MLSTTQHIPNTSNGNNTHNEPRQVDTSGGTRVRGSWRFSILGGVLATTVILIANVVTIVVAYTNYHVEDHSIAFFTGSCRTASMLTTMVHIIVNILSTVLLAASNFAMQCLNSPTRTEVDIAHAKRRWLTIGAPSIRNLFCVSKTKAFLWLVLGASSFPLHMIWNSVVFQTHQVTDNVAVTITENFTHGAYWTVPPLSILNQERHLFISHDRIERLQRQVQNKSLMWLDSETCMETYKNRFDSHVGDVLLVINASTYLPTNPTVTRDATYMASHSSVLAIYDQYFNFAASGATFNGSRCTLSLAYPPNYGDQGGAPVIYCFVQQIRDNCMTNLVPDFVAVVIICNVLKIICLVFVLRITRKEDPLCTLGDAIQSFMKSPDRYTKQCCLATKQDFEEPNFRFRNRWDVRRLTIGVIWKGERSRWIKAVNPWHWVLHIFFILIIIALTGIFANGLVAKVNGIHVSAEPIAVMSHHTGVLSLGVPKQNGTLVSLLVANLVQISISYLYLGLNNILTTMLVMAEWCGYSTESKNQPKGLRVSCVLPGTEQRTTYFISLPYKWGIPKMVCTTVIHWMATEIFCVARVNSYSTDPDEPSLTSRFNFIYASPDAMIYGMTAAGGICFSLLAFSFFMRFPVGIPLAGCCTASIAAACQPPQNNVTPWQQFDDNLSYKRLKWGVVQEPHDMQNGIGHATFSAGFVKPLTKGELYS
ncbi:unnamed protein product [Penicillium salamii]|uniref:DUF6536 domain-containing protein n=1 Tax=Penicillium salamii TaxID=1612424 RepID=A0A9W4N9F8_9EURO|nr:unnamed protein product [Penicillium salamii]